MQLPDWCFGRRWPIITTFSIAPDSSIQYIVDQPLPDRIVIWSIGAWGNANATANTSVKYALGDHPPATQAEFDAFERLFKGDLDNVGEEGGIRLTASTMMKMTMRMEVRPQGRRFAIWMHNGHATVTQRITSVIEISSMPTEVPDWLVSGLDKNQL